MEDPIPRGFDPVGVGPGPYSRRPDERDGVARWVRTIQAGVAGRRGRRPRVRNGSGPGAALDGSGPARVDLAINGVLTATLRGTAGSRRPSRRLRSKAALEGSDYPALGIDEPSSSPGHPFPTAPPRHPCPRSSRPASSCATAPTSTGSRRAPTAPSCDSISDSPASPPAARCTPRPSRAASPAPERRSARRGREPERDGHTPMRSSIRGRIAPRRAPNRGSNRSVAGDPEHRADDLVANGLIALQAEVDRLEAHRARPPTSPTAEESVPRTAPRPPPPGCVVTPGSARPMPGRRSWTEPPAPCCPRRPTRGGTERSRGAPHGPSSAPGSTATMPDSSCARACCWTSPGTARCASCAVPLRTSGTWPAWTAPNPREHDGLTMSSTYDGRILLHGDLSDGAAEVVVTAIHAFTDPPGEDDDRSPARRRADALGAHGRDCPRDSSRAWRSRPAPGRR